MWCSGREMDRDQRVAGQKTSGRSPDRHERRVIDIAPVEALAAGDVIELVAEPAVAPDDEQVKAKLHPCQPEDDGVKAGHGGTLFNAQCTMHNAQCTMHNARCTR